MTHDIHMRDTILKHIRKVLDSDYPEYGIRVSRLENGPPVGFPIQYRVIGETSTS
jgi:multidrug efflux pump